MSICVGLSCQLGFNHDRCAPCLAFPFLASPCPALGISMFGKERMDGGNKVSVSFCYRVKWIQCCSPDLVATFLLQLIFLFDNLFCLFFPLHTVTFFLDPNFSPLSAFTHLALHCDIFKAQHPASLFF